MKAPFAGQEYPFAGQEAPFAVHKWEKGETHTSCALCRLEPKNRYALKKVGANQQGCHATESSEGKMCVCDVMPLFAKLAKGCRCFPPASFHQAPSLHEMPFCRDQVSNCFSKPFCKAIEPFCRALDHAATYFAYLSISCSLAARTDPLVAPAALQAGRSSSTTCLWVFFNFLAWATVIATISFLPPSGPCGMCWM